MRTGGAEDVEDESIEPQRRRAPDLFLEVEELVIRVRRPRRLRERALLQKAAAIREFRIFARRHEVILRVVVLVRRLVVEGDGIGREVVGEHLLRRGSERAEGRRVEGPARRGGAGSAATPCPDDRTSSPRSAPDSSAAGSRRRGCARRRRDCAGRRVVTVAGAARRGDAGREEEEDEHAASHSIRHRPDRVCEQSSLPPHGTHGGRVGSPHVRRVVAAPSPPGDPRRGVALPFGGALAALPPFLLHALRFYGPRIRPRRAARRAPARSLS